MSALVAFVDELSTEHLIVRNKTIAVANKLFKLEEQCIAPFRAEANLYLIALITDPLGVTITFCNNLVLKSMTDGPQTDCLFGAVSLH